MSCSHSSPKGSALRGCTCSVGFPSTKNKDSALPKRHLVKRFTMMECSRSVMPKLVIMADSKCD